MIPGITAVHTLQKSDIWEIFSPTVFSVGLYPRIFNMPMIYIYYKL